jgi:alpha-N-arabinofuranosidase
MHEEQGLVARITVNPQEVIGTVDRNIFGTLIEPIGRCVHGGVWAEVITNRKFWSKPGDDSCGLPAGWQTYGKSEGVSYSLDAVTYCSAPFSLMIKNSAIDDDPRGIRQTGIRLAADKRYQWSLWLRTEESPREIRIGFLLNDQLVASHLVEGPGEQWKRYQGSVGPLPEGEVEVIIFILGKGTVAIDSVSFMPEDNVGGLRRDVLEAIRMLKPSIIRFPGGCFSDNYHWVNGLGDRDRRPATWNRAYEIIEDNDLGINEFMLLCEQIGCEAYINANFGSGTPEEAASWVLYCNEPPDGLHGARRKELGHEEPYNVLLWGVGNEIYGDWETGHTDATTYAGRFRQYSEAMKGADPRIRVVAVGCDPHPFYDVNWNLAFLKTAGSHADYLTVHKYVPGSGNKDLSRYDEKALYHAIVASPHAIEGILHTMDQTIRLTTAPEDWPDLALDEWNIWVHFNLERGIDEQFQMRDALFAAGVFNTLYRLSGRVTLAIQSLLVNVLGAIMTSQTDCHLTAIGRAFELYSNHTGAVSVSSHVTQCPTFEVWHMDELPWMPRVPYVDCSATLSADGRTIFLSIINRHPSQRIECEFTLRNAFPLSHALVWELRAAETNSENSSKDKEAIGIKQRTFDGVGKVFNYQLPEHSVTVLECVLV